MSDGWRDIEEAGYEPPTADEQARAAWLDRHENGLAAADLWAQTIRQELAS